MVRRSHFAGGVAVLVMFGSASTYFSSAVLFDDGGRAAISSDLEAILDTPPHQTTGHVTGKEQHQELFTNSQSDASSSRPTLIFHAGPGKTGTTTIQCQAGIYHKELLEDGFHYLGTATEGCGSEWGRLVQLRYLSQCGTWRTRGGNNKNKNDEAVQQQQQQQCRFQLEEMLKQLDSLHAKNISVLISEEMESPWMNNLLESVKDKWNVRIVLTYRRLHERILSLYWFVFAWHVEVGLYDQWPSSNNNNNNEQSHQNGGNYYWMSETWACCERWIYGAIIPSFPQYIQARPSVINGLLNYFRQDYNNDVQIFNMHDMDGKTSLSGNFFCQVLPTKESSKVCNILSGDSHQDDTRNTASINKKRSKHMLLDRLAVGIYQRGWIPPLGNKSAAVSRKSAREIIEKHYKSILKHKIADAPKRLPLECLSQEDAETFLNTTLETELTWVPSFYHSEAGEQALRAGFANAQKTHKFCSEDVDAVLTTHAASWKKVFARFANTNS